MKKQESNCLLLNTLFSISNLYLNRQADSGFKHNGAPNFLLRRILRILFS